MCVHISVRVHHTTHTCTHTHTHTLFLFLFFQWHQRYFVGEHGCARVPRWLSDKESACQCRRTGDAGFISESSRSPGGGNGNPLQSSCLENAMDRGTWRATVHWVEKELHTTETAKRQQKQQYGCSKTRGFRSGPRFLNGSSCFSLMNLSATF